MLIQGQEKIFLLLRKMGFVLSSASHSKLPRTILRRFFRHSHARVAVVDFDGDLAMELQLSEHMQRRIFWMGYYSQDIACLLDGGLLKPGMTVLDVGANIGEITLLAGKRVGKEGRVFAFEPLDEIANRLERHVQLNHLDQVTIVRCALGDAIDNDIPIYVSCGQEADDENHGLGSLYGGDNGEAPLQRIHMTTLDAWLADRSDIQHIDVIKIDIEGAELACLRGARNCLLRFRPKIIVEIQDFSAARAGYRPTDILDFLSDLDYDFHNIGKGGALTPLTPATLSDFQNVLCRPRDFKLNHP